MALAEATRARCSGVRYVRDRVLSRLNELGAGPPLSMDEVPTARSLTLKTARAERAALPAPGSPEDCPFDLEVPPPYAVDLRHLCSLTGAKVPPEVDAKLGPNVPILICHRMTPFARPGERPPGIWGMGYTAKLGRLPAATTVDLAPSSKLVSLASAEAKLDVGVGAGGEIGLPDRVLEAAGAAVPGWQVSEAKLSVSADARFAFVLSLDLSALEIQAGPVGAGGARWNLYRRAKRIDVTQTLAHTVVVPPGTAALRLAVTTWIRECGFLGGPSKQWTFAALRFVVSLAGLDGAG